MQSTNTVAKKSKKTSLTPETTPAPEPPRAAPSPASRTPAKAKKTTSQRVAKKSASKVAKPRKKTGTALPVPPTAEQIQLRAYFISERRHRLGLFGDASSDWIEALRQLEAEG